MAYEGQLDSDDIDAIEQLLRDGVPDVKSETTETDDATVETLLDVLGDIQVKASESGGGSIYLDGDNQSRRLRYRSTGDEIIIESGSNKEIVVADGQAEFNRGTGHRGNPSKNIAWVGLNTKDVRNISSPNQGNVAYHDGSGSNTEGLAAYNGSSWISQVDGSTIS